MCCAKGMECVSPHSLLEYAFVAQLVEQGIENPRVVGSIPTGGICGFSSFGRARPCQGRGGGFEPRNPLHKNEKRIVQICFFSFLQIAIVRNSFPGIATAVESQ